jgi:hypothetical protein
VYLILLRGGQGGFVVEKLVIAVGGGGGEDGKGRGSGTGDVRRRLKRAGEDINEGK